MVSQIVEELGKLKTLPFENVKFPEILRMCREFIGLQQSKVAELVGVYQNTLKNLEYGHFKLAPKDSVIMALAKLYDIPTDFLRRKAKEHVKSHPITRSRKKRKLLPMQTNAGDNGILHNEERAEESLLQNVPQPVWQRTI